MQLYSTFAPWWSVLTPEGTYDLEAEFFCALLGTDIKSIMELGSGIGAMASSFPSHLHCVLVDQSPQMIEQSQLRNPQAIHICASIEDIFLEEKVDAVLIHDAVMYMDTLQKLHDMFLCAYRHLNVGGCVLIVPDVVFETFEEHSLSGGAQDGKRAIQVLEWHWRPEPKSKTYQVEFSVLTRENGEISSHHESHTLGLYRIEEYAQVLRDVGFSIVEIEEEGRYFLAKK